MPCDVSYRLTPSYSTQSSAKLSLTSSQILLADSDIFIQYSELEKSTFDNDLRELVGMELLVKIDDKYMANTSVLYDALPEKRTQR